VDTHELIKLRLALVPYNANFKVIRRRIFLNSLRVARYVHSTKTEPHELWDPSGLAMHVKIHGRKRSIEELELNAMIKNSQACALYFDDFNWNPESIETEKVAAVMRILERTGKTPILGARFQRTVVTAELLKHMKTLKGDVGRLHEELAALLGGAAQSLSATLSSPATGLAFTLEGLKKTLEQEQEQEQANPGSNIVI
jgi:hypothetical protein